MKITYYGHAALGIETNGFHLLVDPFISGNPKASGIDINSLKADYILLTHAHYDHVLDVEAIVKRTNAQLISNHEIVTRYEEKGIKGHAMNHGGSWNFEFGTLKMVNAIHSSSFPDGAYGGNPAGFILKGNTQTVYMAGDTALTFDMKLIPIFHQVDLAILPVGGNFTMDVDEALVAADFVECSRVLGVHFDTAAFIEIDHEQSKKKFRDQGKELILLDIGASLSL